MPWLDRTSDDYWVSDNNPPGGMTKPAFLQTMFWNGSAWVQPDNFSPGGSVLLPKPGDVYTPSWSAGFSAEKVRLTTSSIGGPWLLYEPPLIDLYVFGTDTIVASFTPTLQSGSLEVMEVDIVYPGGIPVDLLGFGLAQMYQGPSDEFRIHMIEFFTPDPAGLFWTGFKDTVETS